MVDLFIYLFIGGLAWEFEFEFGDSYSWFDIDLVSDLHFPHRTIVLVIVFCCVSYFVSTVIIIIE